MRRGAFFYKRLTGRWMGNGRLTPEQYRLIVENSPSMIRRDAADGRADYVNPTWLDFTGRTSEAELGEGWLAGIHEEDLPRYRKVRAAHVKYREPFEVQYRLRRHDGVHRYVFERSVPFEGAEGELGGYIATCADVDDRTRADEGKAAFLAMLAHELRTPLTPMAGYVHQMQRKIGRGEPIFIEMVQKLARQVERVEALVEHLADASRINAGKAVGIAAERLDLTHLVHELIERHGSGTHLTRRTELVYEGDGEERILFADGTRLRQVLRHLLDNAIKFSPRGGTIRVRLESSPFQHVLAISDHGIGIPEGDLRDVTKPYFRATNASPDNYPGIGLGLAIAREIIEAHGGDLRVESALGRGTVVTVRFPAASAEA